MSDDQKNGEMCSSDETLGSPDLSSADNFRNDPEVKKLLEEMVLDNRTQMVCLRLIEKGGFTPPDNLSPHGYYLGTRIIGRDSQINGGLYLGGHEREAILVDDRLDDGVLSQVLFTLIAEIFKKSPSRMANGIAPTALLADVFSLVRSTLPYDRAKVEAVTVGKYADKEIKLSEFVIGKCGVCRHQALLAAYLIEKLIEKGLIQGKVSIDRNYMALAGGAHAWVRFECPDGEVIIIDPAQDYVGPIDDAPECGWFYDGVKRLAPEKQWPLDLMEASEVKPVWERPHLEPKVVVNGPLSSEQDDIVVLNGATAFKINNERLQIFVCGRRDPASTIDLWRDSNGEYKLSYLEKGVPTMKVAKTLMNVAGEIGVEQSDRSDQLFITSNSPFNFCTIIFKDDSVVVTDHGKNNKTAVRVVKEDNLATLLSPLFILPPEKPAVVVNGKTEPEPETDLQMIDGERDIDLPEGMTLLLMLDRVEIRLFQDAQGAFQITYTDYSGKKELRAVREIMKTPGVILIGKSFQCDYVINHPSISPVHCRLYFHEKGLTITDFDSAHGTFFKVV